MGDDGRDAPGRRLSTPLLAASLAAAGLFGAVLAYLQKGACRFGGAWNHADQQFVHNCYTDIYPLYFQRGFADGKLAYLEHEMEYPVGIGAFMQVIAWLVEPLGDVGTRGVAFYDITVAVMAGCLVVGVLAVAALAGPRRRWDALWYALSPALVLTAYINWDLLVGALALTGLVAWSRRRHVLAGVLLGLAVATKFYPLFLVGPFFLLALRTARWRAFGAMFGAGVATWLVVNVPMMIATFDGWKRFYTFSEERGADWGSLWFFFQMKQVPVLGDPENLDTLGVLSFAALCLIIAVLALTAPSRPRLMQLCFLVVAAFMISNKVWSPQYVLWLLPFAVLAQPRRLALALWTAAEVWYFFAIWGYLLFINPEFDHEGVSDGWYFGAVWARALTIVLMVALVIRDMYAPGRDPVRRGGVDDPAGGVFDGAADRFTLRRGRPAVPAGAADLVAKSA
ncbi:glycosyltransferase family 87 protein [Bailinhaonella thermotolerans]|uniref:DUF2029 domain-containing protein n=1 Tax=Bailinhaonella thermotolerans TaxID=1070861 RepID=A0A3A4AU27_9ACTN|nr:glycosyltransferase 87 family protein [Bailinhaonella thermotolerans]RJL32129.1 DUF2029 domain-containing protein [Bailinhaonella thermotolerans]